jgi:RNA polymerase sigma-70 factor, ECF subfamily
MRGGSWTVDVEALEKIVQCEGQHLLAYARMMTRHAQDAEDVLQEALSKVSMNHSTGIDNLTAYLYTAVRHAALNGLRARVRRWRREQTAMDIFPVFQEPASRKEEVEALNAALATLPLEQREVVMMKAWGGLSFAEIAEAIGIPRDTAASRYRYALDALRKQMRTFTHE